MKKTLFLMAAMLLCSLASMAQIDKIVGDWKTVDDKTGQSFSIIHIFKATDGFYYGKITKMLMNQDEKCVECTGADKDKPLEGLMIIRKFSEKDGELVGGRVLDPENGKFYYGKIYYKDGKLVLRGSIDKAGILGRSQTWLPAK